LRRAWAEAGRDRLPEHVVMIPPDKTATWQEDLGHEVICAWIADANVPREVAIVGCDDEPSSRHMQPALASLGQPGRDMGYAASDTLISMVSAREAVPSLRLLPMRLIERASLGIDG
jgi:DNA-binding LacI/PurR family transcriptional regulator